MIWVVLLSALAGAVSAGLSVYRYMNTRKRLLIKAYIQRQLEQPPYRFDVPKLLVRVINPSENDIRLKSIKIYLQDIPWILSPQLEAEESQPPCMIPSEDSRLFWIDALKVGEFLIDEDRSGDSFFRVSVATTTNKEFDSAYVDIDLNHMQKELDYRTSKEEAARARKIAQALENES